MTGREIRMDRLREKKPAELIGVGTEALTPQRAGAARAHHLGGKVTTVFDRGDPLKETTKTYKDYVRAAGDKRRTIEVGATINLGRGLSVQHLPL